MRAFSLICFVFFATYDVRRSFSTAAHCEDLYMAIKRSAFWKVDDSQKLIQWYGLHDQPSTIEDCFVSVDWMFRYPILDVRTPSSLRSSKILLTLGFSHKLSPLTLLGFPEIYKADWFFVKYFTTMCKWVLINCRVESYLQMLRPFTSSSSHAYCTEDHQL